MGGGGDGVWRVLCAPAVSASQECVCVCVTCAPRREAGREARGGGGGRPAGENPGRWFLQARLGKAPKKALDLSTRLGNKNDPALLHSGTLGPAALPPSPPPQEKGRRGRRWGVGRGVGGGGVVQDAGGKTKLGRARASERQAGERKERALRRVLSVRRISFARWRARQVLRAGSIWIRGGAMESQSERAGAAASASPRGPRASGPAALARSLSLSAKRRTATTPPYLPTATGVICGATGALGAWEAAAAAAAAAAAGGGGGAAAARGAAAAAGEEARGAAAAADAGGEHF